VACTSNRSALAENLVVTVGTNHAFTGPRGSVSAFARVLLAGSIDRDKDHLLLACLVDHCSFGRFFVRSFTMLDIRSFLFKVTCVLKILFSLANRNK
jgi:hypothetical protein